MTDAEIIKALECCSTYGMSCKHCPAFVKVDRSKCREVLMGAKNLINRLKAENEKYKTTFEAMVNVMVEAKSEAYKEFAEFLKARKIIADTSNYYGKECITEVVIVEDIDNLLKEMG